MKKTNRDFATRENFDSSHGIFTLINSQNDNFWHKNMMNNIIWWNLWEWALEHTPDVIINIEKVNTSLTHTYIEYIEFCLNTSKLGYSLYHTAHIFQIQDEFHSKISRSEHKLNRLKRNLAYHYQRYLNVTFSGIELRLIENKNKIKN